MAANRTASVKLRFETDKASFANVRANIQALQQELSRLDRQWALSTAARDAADFANAGGNARVAVMRLKELGANASEISKVKAEFVRLTTEAERSATALTKSINQQIGLFSRYQEAAQSATSGVASVGGAADTRSGRNNKLRALGRAARVNLPAMPIAGGYSTEQIARLVEGVGFAFGSLSKTSLGATAAIAGLGAVLVIAANNTNKYREVLASQLDAQERAREEVRNSTAEELRAKQQKAQENLARLEEEERLARETYVRLREEVRAAFGDVGVAITDINKTLGTGGAEFKAVEDDLDKAVKATAAARAELGIYDDAIGSTTFATKEAAEAERKLAEERQKFYDAFVNAEVSALRDARNIQDTSALDERVQSLRDERQLYQDIIASRNLSEEAEQSYLDKIRDINAAIQVFTREGLVAEIEARERERHAIEAATKARERNVAQQEALAKAQDDAAKATGDFNASLEKIASDARSKLADAARDREKALVDAEVDAQKARAEASRDRETSLTEVTRKAGVDREKQEREHLKRLQEIQRRFQLDEATAIEDRDAVALDRARRERDEAVRSETDNAAEQRADIDRNLAEQTRTINTRYAEQTASINMRLSEQTAAVNARYAEQVQTIYAAANAARQAEVASYQQRLATLAQFVQSEVKISAQGAGALLGVQQQYWQAALSLASSALNSIRATQAQGVQFRGNTQVVTRSTQAIARGTGRAMVAFDTGGYITRTGAAMVHAGEYIMNPRRGQYPVNFAPVVNMAGQGGTEQIRQMLHAEVDRFAEQLVREAM